MLVIRKEQIESLSDSLRESFKNRSAAYLRKHAPVPTAGLSDDELHQKIGTGEIAARRYMITIEWDVCRFVEAMLYCVEGFDNDLGLAWIGEILRDESLTGTSKMDRIEYRLRQDGIMGISRTLM